MTQSSSPLPSASELAREKCPMLYQKYHEERLICGFCKPIEEAILAERARHEKEFGDLNTIADSHRQHGLGVEARCKQLEADLNTARAEVAEYKTVANSLETIQMSQRSQIASLQALLGEAEEALEICQPTDSYSARKREEALTKIRQRWER